MPDLVRHLGLRYPVVLDDDQSILKAWGAGGWPLSVALDARSRLAEVLLKPQGPDALAGMVTTAGG